MDDLTLGAENLAAFVATTAGRTGTVAEIRGGLAVAGPVAVANGFVDGTVPIDAGSSPADLLDDAIRFYAALGRAFVLWVPVSTPDLADEAVRRGGVSDASRAPAMSIRHRIPVPAGLDLHPVADGAEGEIFGDLAERGYGLPGLGWLMTHHDCFAAPGCTWVIASEGTQPLGVAGGFLHRARGATVGGVYYVATPEEHRGRGVAATATAWVTNHLFDEGADVVVLQASDMGFPIYQRLGFEVYDTYQRFTFPAPTDGSDEGRADDRPGAPTGPTPS
jgi:GNAT superfamily N-acetyltransferase